MGAFDDLIPGGSAAGAKPAKPGMMGGRGAGTAGQQQAAQARQSALNALVGQVRRVDQLYNQDFAGGWAEKGPAVLGEYINSAPASQRFNSASAGLNNPFMAAFRVPGNGSQSDLELKAFIDSNQPNNDDTDERIQEKLRNIRNRVNEEVKSKGLPAPNWGAKPLSPSIKRIR